MLSQQSAWIILNSAGYTKRSNTDPEHERKAVEPGTKRRVVFLVVFLAKMGSNIHSI